MSSCTLCELHKNLPCGAEPVWSRGEGYYMLDFQPKDDDIIMGEPSGIDYQIIRKYFHSNFRYGYLVKCPGKVLKNHISTCFNSHKENSPIVFLLGIKVAKFILKGIIKSTTPLEEIIGKTYYKDMIKYIPTFQPQMAISSKENLEKFIRIFDETQRFSHAGSIQK